MREDVEYLNIKGAEIPIIFEESSLLPIGFVSVIFNGGGSINHKAALSAFSTDMLERGTMKKGEYAFANELESNAINLSVNNGLETLSFEIEFLKEHEDDALRLLGELLSDPNLSDEAFNQTKLNIKSYLLGKENDFDYIAKTNLNRLIFAHTPLVNPSFGSIQDIDNITLKDVRNFIQKTFVLDNVVILIGGDMNLESTKTKLARILDFLPRGQKYVSQKYATSDTRSDIIDVRQTKQATIYFASPFAFKGYEEELHKAQIMGFIMGSSGFGSRIMEEIRVKRGLAYSAYFYNAINNVTSYTMGYLQTKLENKDDAIKAVKETIAAFIEHAASQEELDDAKAYILGSQVLGYETLSQRLNKKYINFHRGLPLDYDKIRTQKIRDLSLDELNSYIRSHKEVNNLSFSVVVDK